MSESEKNISDSIKLNIKKIPRAKALGMTQCLSSRAEHNVQWTLALLRPKRSGDVEGSYKEVNDG